MDEKIRNRIITAVVFLSEDGYIRTYFVADKDYFDRQ